MTYARRKTLTGVEPAHLNAPPRLRQSDIARPFVLMDDDRGFFSRLLFWRNA